MVEKESINNISAEIGRGADQLSGNQELQVVLHQATINLPNLHSPQFALNQAKLSSLFTNAKNGATVEAVTNEMNSAHLFFGSQNDKLALLHKLLSQNSNEQLDQAITRVLRSFGSLIHTPIPFAIKRRIISDLSHEHLSRVGKLLTDELKRWISISKPPQANDMDYHNTIIGLDGVPFAARSVKLNEIQPLNLNGKLLSTNQKRAPIILVNGLNTSLEEHVADMHQLCELLEQEPNKHAGFDVVGLHYATSGNVETDIKRALKSRAIENGNLKHFFGCTVIRSLANLIIEAIKNRITLRIVAPSNGAFLASKATKLALHTLKKLDITDSSCLKVFPLAPAEFDFPDGPTYIHYINQADPIPFLLGVAHAFGIKEIKSNDESLSNSIAGKVASAVAHLVPKNLTLNPGAGAKFRTFYEPGPHCHSPHTHISRLKLEDLLTA